MNCRKLRAVVQSPVEITRFSESDSTSDDNDGTFLAEIEPKLVDLNGIRKYVKYAQTGDQTATVIALRALKEEELRGKEARSMMAGCGGARTLVNLLETDHLRCNMVSLSILVATSRFSRLWRHTLILSGAIPALLNVLRNHDKRLHLDALRVLGNLVASNRAKKLTTKYAGLPLLITAIEMRTVNAEAETNSDSESAEMATVACEALSSISEWDGGRTLLRERSIVAALIGLLRYRRQPRIRTAALAILANCLTRKEFEDYIAKSEIIRILMRFLKEENDRSIKKLCCVALSKCANNEVIGDLVRELGGLEALLNCVKECGWRPDGDGECDVDSLATVTEAVWRCCSNARNVNRHDQLNAVNIAISLLSADDERVVTNAVGTLAECAKNESVARMIVEEGVVPRLKETLSRQMATSDDLPTNVADTMARCARCEPRVGDDCARSLWSLLANPSSRVRARAAAALVSCITDTRVCGETVRSLSGGLETLIQMLRRSKWSDQGQLLSGVCACIARVALNDDNLAVISDLGVVPALAHLLLQPRRNEILEVDLSEAIANCCASEANCVQLGRLKAIGPIVGYLKSRDIRVRRNAALALRRLSTCSDNCVTLYRCAAVELLLKTISSPNEELQEYSAECLFLMRKLAREQSPIGEQTA